MSHRRMHPPYNNAHRDNVSALNVNCCTRPNVLIREDTDELRAIFGTKEDATPARCLPSWGSSYVKVVVLLYLKGWPALIAIEFPGEGPCCSLLETHCPVWIIDQKMFTHLIRFFWKSQDVQFVYRCYVLLVNVSVFYFHCPIGALLDILKRTLRLYAATQLYSIENNKSEESLAFYTMVEKQYRWSASIKRPSYTVTQHFKG